VRGGDTSLTPICTTHIWRVLYIIKAISQKRSKKDTCIFQVKVQHTTCEANNHSVVKWDKTKSVAEKTKRGTVWLDVELGSEIKDKRAHVENTLRGWRKEKKCDGGKRGTFKGEKQVKKKTNQIKKWWGGWGRAAGLKIDTVSATSEIRGQRISGTTTSSTVLWNGGTQKKHGKSIGYYRGTGPTKQTSKHSRRREGQITVPTGYGGGTQQT